MTIRLIKEGEKKKKSEKNKATAWRNSLIVYWEAGAQIPDVCELSTPKTRRSGLSDIYEQFPVDGQSSCNTIEIQEAALG